MGGLCYRTLKDTSAGHHHAGPLYPLLQSRREKDGERKDGRKMKAKKKKKKLRERPERFNNRETEEVLPCYSFIIGLQGRSNERLLIAHSSSTKILVHLYNQSPFKEH